MPHAALLIMLGTMASLSTSTSDEFRGLGPPLDLTAAGLRLDCYLAQRFPFKSRQEWKQTCNNGHILLNGYPVKPTKRLNIGDILQVYHPLSSEPQVNGSIELLWEKGGIMALNKPGNLPMHESGEYRRNTLVAMVQHEFGFEWAPVHRLDRETSGVVICAATSQLRQHLSQQFVERTVQKEYCAILHGSPDWDRISVEQPLLHTMIDNRPRRIVMSGGDYALTEFKVRQRALNATLVIAVPKTGRNNQIRAHAHWLGHHIVGDKVYSCPTKYPTNQFNLSRHALHAQSLHFRCPVTNEELFALAPMPRDLRNAWGKLGTK